MVCGWTRGLKPHDSRLGFPSGLSWALPPLFWWALDLEGFFLCSKEWDGGVRHPGALHPCQDDQLRCDSGP